MSRVLAIARRELRSSFNSPVAYGVIISFLLFTAVSLFFLSAFFTMNQADLRQYFDLMLKAFAFVIPAITMRAWAEERRTGTYELLLTLPFTEAELVLGKFLAAFALALVAILLTIPVPLAISLLGSFDPGVLVAQYLGVILAAGAAVALGQWVSSLAKNQISAFLGAAFAMIFLVFINALANFLQFGGVLAAILNWLSLAFHYEAFSRGVADSRDLAYFIAFGVLFLYLSTWNLTRRKWS
ncbi:MAG TPA: ABC transporter permease subunit [Rectinemataceae bacterium]|nr:ABC transporter permease subunit [Rectinemataceae bacterium]